MSFSNKRNAESKRHISLVMQTLHKWLSLIVGLQLLIWIVTGPISHYASNSESHYCTRPHG